jgi:GNAT superfamily N-acetyltransferase
MYRSVKQIAEIPMLGFFEGWPRHPDETMHRKILADSYAVSVAVGGNRVVGFANAISDGHLSAYIPLLEVLPDWRGKGLARALIGDLLEQLGGLYMIDLCCDAELEGLYQELGFTADGPNGKIRGMVRRDRTAQCGM